MNGGLAIGAGAATAAAVTMTLGSLYRQQGASSARPVTLRRPLLSTRGLFAHRAFGVGMALTALSAGLHVVGLAFAPLSVVQVILAGGMVLLGVLGGRILGVAVPGRQWWGLLAGTAGLVLYALLLPSVRGASAGYRDVGLGGGLAVLAATAGILALAGGRLPQPHRHRGHLVGASAGAVFSASDVAMKAALGIFAGTTPPGGAAGLAVAAVAAGILGQLAAARALQVGEALGVLALTNLVTNAGNVATGIVVFADPLPRGAAGKAGEATALALVCLAAALTPRRPA